MIKRNRNTNTKGNIQYMTAQAEMQEDSSFAAYGTRLSFTKRTKGQRQTESGQTMTIRPHVLNKLFEPTHEIMVLFVLRELLLQMRMRSQWARCLIFSWTLCLHPYFMCANSEGSGETARMRRLAWAFAGRLCDKYHNLISWLIWVESNRGFNTRPRLCYDS